MDHAEGWMDGQMWIWPVLGLAVAALLVVIFSRVSRKSSS